MKKLLSSLLFLALVLSLCAIPAAALSTDDARQLLRDCYVDPLPDQTLDQDSLEDILTAIGDPYTSYMSAERYQDFLNSVNGQSLVGIGVSIQNAFDDGYLILSVFDDSPAREAGIQAGDRIIAVDGQAVSADLTPQPLIAGEEGTPVTVTLIRRSNGRQEDITLIRRTVTVPIVTGVQRGPIGWIDCTSFGASTSGSVEQAIRTLDKDTTVWVMDLRSNPGGTVQAAVASAGAFLGGDKIMTFFSGQMSTYYYSTTSAMADLTDKPLIILTSPYSASGSELFSAAIRDYSGGIVLGQRTFGKGVAQTIFDEDNTDGMFDGDCLKITTHRFYSPEGVTNHIVGVLPTLMVSLENSTDAARVLSAPQPERASGCYRLELAGQTFYIDGSTAADTCPAAFAEVLSALPPSAKLCRGDGRSTWTETTPAEAAAQCGLTAEYEAYSNDFTDIGGAQHQREITTLAVYDLVSGYGDGTFRPDNTVTRAEFAAMLAAALNLSGGGTSAFTDVSAGAWYAGSVSAMAAKGFLAGYEDGTFRPDNTITYQEMVTVLSSVAAWCLLDGDELRDTELSANDWAIYYDWADWAQIPARNLVGLGVSLDVDAYGAQGTRDKAAGLLCQLMKSLHLLWD